MSSLYKTVVTNLGGGDGTVSADNGQTFELTALSNEPTLNPNPEQFMGYAWSTCLNATLLSLMKNMNPINETRVTVSVEFVKEPAKPGFYFDMKATVAIKDMDDAEVLKLAENAHKFCPVSKLISENEHVSVDIEPF